MATDCSNLFYFVDLDKAKIKEKLKANCLPSSQKSENTKRPGPMRSGVGKQPRTYPYSIPTRRDKIQGEVVKRNADIKFQVQSVPLEVLQLPDGISRPSRTPSPSSMTTATDFPYLRHSQRRHGSPSPHTRTQSPKRTRTDSTGPDSRSRSRSPNTRLRGNSGDDILKNIFTVKKQIKKLQDCRLYLLHQPGPHSFTVAKDSSDNAYRVNIGPQTCTCAERNHCVHLLFVMLRVLKVRENDPCLFNKSLKNYEVESLFSNYDKRRSCLTSPSPAKDTPTPDSTVNESSNDLQIELSASAVECSQDDYNMCPICLYEVRDTEELMSCRKGCKNKLHSACMRIMMEHCREAEVDLKCPFCRIVWSAKDLESNTIDVAISVDIQDHDISSTVDSIENTFTESQLLPAVINPKHTRMQWDIKSEWLEVFEKADVSLLQSVNWAMREDSVKLLTGRTEIKMSELTNDVMQFNLTHSPQWIKVTTSFSEILRIMVDDPVYRVYTACLSGVTSLIGYYMCISNEDEKALSNLLRPIMKVIIKKCADGNRRTAEASLAIILKLAFGQDGEIAVGGATLCPAQIDICGLSFILSCILESDCNDNSRTAWQQILGQLYALDELIEAFPQEFRVFDANKENFMPVKTRLVNQERIISVLKFALPFIKHSHPNIRKMALRVSIRSVRLTSESRLAYSRTTSMLFKTDSSLKERLRERTLSYDFEDYSDRPYKQRHSLGWSVPTSPCCASSRMPFQNRNKCYTPLSYRRASLPVLNRSLSTTPTPHRSRTPSSSCLPQPQSPLSRPQRPNFLPINGQMCFKQEANCQLQKNNLKHHKVYVQRKQSCPAAGMEDSACCFNHICHVHELPCDQRCQSKRRKARNLPAPPPNTPQCPVGDLIDLSAPVGGHIRFPSNVFRRTHISPSGNCLLDSIPEINNANTPALRFSHLVHPNDSLLYRGRENFIHQSPFHCTYSSSSCMSTLSVGDFIGNRIQNEENFSFFHNESYVEGIDWVRCNVIGQGGFSTCYLARDLRTGAFMAVKQVPFECPSLEDQERIRASIRNEILLMQKLDHPNIVRLLGAVQQKNTFDLFVEWMPAGSVASVLAKWGPFSELVIVTYTSHVLKGLAYLHENRILHRDLKGANLLIDSTGHQVRIADFGAARQLCSQATLSKEFKGEMLGTIAYMAPEVLRGEPYGRSCDVWSVGCCVIEMVTTKQPWSAPEFTNDYALYYTIASTREPPPIPSGMSPDIVDFTLQCLQVKNSNRPTTKELLMHPCFVNPRRNTK